MQASLAVAGTVLSIAAWFDGAGIMWLVTGLLLGSVLPFTLIVIAPTNHRLNDRNLHMSGDYPRHLQNRWGHLHAVRSALSLIALMLMILPSIIGPAQEVGLER